MRGVERPAPGATNVGLSPEDFHGHGRVGAGNDRLPGGHLPHAEASMQAASFAANSWTWGS